MHLPSWVVFLLAPVVLVAGCSIVGGTLDPLSAHIRSRRTTCLTCCWWLEDRRERDLGLCRLGLSLRGAADTGRCPVTAATDFCTSYERWRHR